MTAKPILPDEALAQHLAIVGNSGAGKSYCAKGLVEGLLTAERRVCILDPTGAWWGLRSSADGKREGFPVVVFGGAHADVPINEHSGEALAKIIGDDSRNVPAILDLSEMLRGERNRFVATFADALYRHNRKPLHLVVDEADEFCPQNPMPGTELVLGHMDRIVRRGRIRGFRVMLITQRPAVVNKNVLTQVQTLIALRLTAPQDRKAILAWVEGNADKDAAREVLDTLAKLARGEGWVWSPAADILHRMQFPRIKTFDSSRTPENDEAIAKPTKLAAVDLRGIRETFAAIENEAKSVENMKAENKRLAAELANAKSPRDVEEIVQAAVTADRAKRERKMAETMAAAHKQSEALASLASALRDELGARLGMFPHPSTAQPLAPLSDEYFAKLEREAYARPTKVPTSAFATRMPLKKEQSAGSLAKGEALVLSAIAMYPEGVDRPQLMALTSYAERSLSTYISALTTAGLAEVSRGSVVATQLAHDNFGPFERLPVGRALLDYWLDKLGGGARELLAFIAGTREGVTREQIQTATNYAERSVSTYLSALRTRKLAVVERGMVRAADILFD